MATTKVVTGAADNVRFSYAHVFEPSAMEEGMTKKYSVSILIPKTRKKLLAEIEAAIKLALEQGIAKFGGKIPANWKNPLRDGDTNYPDDEAYEGHMFINANNTRKPGVLDEHGNAILDAEEFYSGCYGRASVNFFAFNTAGNKGVGTSLSHLQKLKDGEKLGGNVASAESDFGVDDSADDLM